MEALYVLIPFSTLIAGLFLFLFLRSADSGQFDDMESPAKRMLLEDTPIKPIPQKGKTHGS